MFYKRQPLPAGFMIASMFGLIISIVYTASGRWNKTWGFTLALLFAIMFISSMVSLEPNKVPKGKRKYAEETKFKVIKAKKPAKKKVTKKVVKITKKKPAKKKPVKKKVAKKTVKKKPVKKKATKKKSKR